MFSCLLLSSLCLSALQEKIITENPLEAETVSGGVCYGAYFSPVVIAEAAGAAAEAHGAADIALEDSEASAEGTSVAEAVAQNGKNTTKWQ